MEHYINLLAGYGNLLFFIAIIEAIIIIILVILLYRRKDAVDESENVAYLKNEIKRWKKTCQNLNLELHDLKKESGVMDAEKSKRQPSQVPYSNKQSSDKEPQRTNFDDFVDFATKEREKEAYVKETINEDGTVRSEVIYNQTEDKPTSVSISPKYEYLETANNGQFRKLLPSEEKCFFRTWEENGTRKFEFHGNVDKALANINAFFDDVCEIEGKQNGATQIENVEPGILNSQLIVEKKAKIKLT